MRNASYEPPSSEIRTMRRLVFALGVAVIGGLVACGWNAATKSDEPHPPLPSPTRHQVVTSWCEPKDVPLYNNGTDCP